jgi:hypothetical protein
MNEVGRVVFALACTALASLTAYYLIVFMLKAHG